MKAPPLPDAFGNYALGAFAEVVPPEPVSWLPQTTGWAVVGLLLIGFALRIAWRRLRRWHRNRYRREATIKLQALSRQPDGAVTADVNRLLKLAVLAHRPRREAAALSGQAWVDYLNGLCPAPVFQGDAARLLISGGYHTRSPQAVSDSRLVEASLLWLQQHRDPADA